MLPKTIEKFFVRVYVVAQGPQHVLQRRELVDKLSKIIRGLLCNKEAIVIEIPRLDN